MRMNRCAIAFLISVVIVTGALPFVASGMDDATRGYSTLNVGEDKDYRTINEALENASSGDRIVVFPGSYYESIVINKSLTLEGKGMDNTGLIASSGGVMATVKADGCTISGFAFIGGEDTEACLVLNSSKNTVSSCLFKNGRSAVKMSGGSDNTLMDNLMSYNGDPDGTGESSDLEDGVVAYYKMDENEWIGNPAEVIDSSGNGLHGRPMKGAKLDSDGKFNTAGHFDGVDDYVELEDYELLDFGTGPFSVSVWIRLDKDCPENIGNKIVQKRGGRDKSWGQITGWMMAVQRVGDSVYVKNTGVDDGMGNSIELANMQYVGKVDTWIHLVFTWDTTSAYLYVNGGERTYSKSNPNVGNISNSRKATIGCHWNNATFQDQFFHGLIDEVRIYDKVLNVDGIDSLYRYQDRPYSGALIMEGTTDSLIWNNTISYNYANGVVLLSSDSNVIMNNTILRNNGYALLLDERADGNVIYQNEIAQNNGDGKQAYDDGGSNNWDYSGSGNFWSDWTSPDTDRNWIVDYPYIIEGSSKARDNYPLIHKVDVNKAPTITTGSVPPAYAGERYSFAFEATDAETDADDLEWEMETNATWLSVNGNGVSGSPSSANVGSFWIHATVSDGELSDSANYTMRVQVRETNPQEGEWENDLDVDDLFPPRGDGETEYHVEENEDVDVEVKEDGTIEIEPLTEWEGYQDVVIEQTYEGEKRDRMVIILRISENGGFEPMVLLLESGVDHFLVAYVDPELGLIEPYIYSWQIEGIGAMGNMSFLEFTLPDGKYLLTLEITDKEGNSVRSSYRLVVGPEEEGGRKWQAATYGMIAILAVIFAIMATIIFGFMIRKRRSRSPASDLSVRDVETGYQEARVREERGGLPSESPHGYAPQNLPIGDGLVRGGSLDDRTDTRAVPIWAANGGPRPTTRSIGEEAVSWEGKDDMGMTDHQIMEGLGRRFRSGKISERTYRRLSRKLDGWDP
ncbi:MAG: nitrous oxide reductase family maturation protein NosD [Thermoplasmatota archaeon]